MLLFVFDGLFLLRFAERQFLALLFQLPPRFLHPMVELVEIDIPEILAGQIADRQPLARSRAVRFQKPPEKLQQRAILDPPRQQIQHDSEVDAVVELVDVHF